MKRVHVLEFEDLAWFPAWLRTCMTNLIVVFARVMGVNEVVGRLVARVLKQAKTEEIVDLGSGSGGSMPEVLALLRDDPDTANTRLTMTDLYPNLDAIETFNHTDTPHMRYLSEPVNATDLASAPSGLKTMTNCFHHMRPGQARTILESAQKSRQPLLVYEVGDNAMPFAVWCLALPIGLLLVGLSALVLTPMVRPVTFRQLFFTYGVPIIPIFYAWDGQASMPRIYTLEDLDELLEGLDAPGYRWEKGLAKTAKGRKRGIYLVGLPC